ncbi:hypothetical protein U3516DRAFT_857021 [Neocallimastix sp. 'constans']
MKFTLGLLFTSSLLLKNTKAVIPNCSDCSVYTTGKDGSLWGWENDSFCKIPSSCSNGSENNESNSTTNSSTKSIVENKNDNSKASNSSASDDKNNGNGNAICKSCVVTGTGGDGSLWGWEDNASCSIDKAKCEGKLEENDASGNDSSSSGANDKVICNECMVTATGSDGSLWGWENQASCVIDKAKCNFDEKKPSQKPLERGPDGVLICSTCEYTRIDEDTTTWSTENGEDCRVIGSRCGINTTPHPWCNGCDVTGTGGDGALYGWENNGSCLINEITCKIVESTGNYVNVSSASVLKIISFKYVIASLAIIYFIRGF